MDISRPELVAQRKRRRLIVIAIAALVLIAVIIWVMRLEPAVPTIDRGTVWLDTVERGEMLRQVRGNGTLIPEDILVVPTEVGGRVVRIETLPGAIVEPDTVLLELSNPQLKQQAFELEFQLKGARARLNQLEVQLEESRLALEVKIADLMSQLNFAKVDAEANKRLAAKGFVPELTLNKSTAQVADTERRLELEKNRLITAAESAEAQIAVQLSDIAKLEAASKLKNEEVDSLIVRAGIKGVVQQIGPNPERTMEVGERVGSGAVLAEIVEPSKLMARIRVAETQAKDVAIGLPATIDTRNGEIPGEVCRVDPSVVNGTVTVDVELTGPLPDGARPDLNIDGVIELERLPDIIYVGRPVQGQEDATVGLFKIVDKNYAAKVSVTFGRASVTTIEIVQGLEPGDEVILSDMSAFEDEAKLRLK
jgi:HlyD family secretion protein